MDAKGIAFLRGMGMPEEMILILKHPGQACTVDAESLESWLRASYLAGKNKRQDVYAWYSVEELMGRPLA